MKLVEDGMTRLDVPVAEILPQFDTPPYNGVTLYQLLTHTSGMHTDAGCFDNKYQTNYWQMIDNAYKLHDPEKDGEFDWITAGLATIGTGFRAKPDTEWGYCSFGFVILGAVIEKLTGIHAHQYIEDNICKPLGLTDTRFEMTKEMAKRKIIRDADEEKYVNEVIAGTYKPDWVGAKLNIPSTGGGLSSTVWDMVRFGNMALHGGTFDNVRILGKKSLEKMTATALDLPDYCWNPGRTRRYGIGFDRRDDLKLIASDSTYMHEGAGACALYMDPQEEIVAAWIVPYANEGWFPRAVHSPCNIVWSGIK
jgi:CubicO group peptidase (beta-lactamase class C family)